jgi:hypothetical protein
MRHRCVFTLILAHCASAHAAGETAKETERWLGGLYDRVAADLAAGRPLVVEAHVALCDNAVITCGGHGLGDGDDLERNLYWATSGGMRGWFDRRGSGWKRVRKDDRTDGEAILSETVWHRQVTPDAAWQRRGVKRPFDVYVVAHAWRGAAIDDALESWIADLYGSAPREVALSDGKVLHAGGAAAIVAWIGHNRFMDRPPQDWAGAARAGDSATAKGMIAVACMTRRYLAREVASEKRVPLLLTEDFLFAGAHSFEGALRAFLDGKSYLELKDAAAQAYADGEKKTFAHVHNAFINPGDRRWR